jgi:hypothetical protein
MGCIYLVRVRDQWKSLVYTTLNLGFRENRRHTLVTEQLLALKKGLGSMELVNILHDKYIIVELITTVQERQ